MLREWIAVGLGGMLGALARHGLAGLFSLIGEAWLLIATLAVNVAGCFAIGLLVQWSIDHQMSKAWWVIGVRVGLLGGLTTFSTFALDVVKLWQQDRVVPSFGLVATHVLVGIAAVVCGLALAKSFGSNPSLET